MSIIAVAGLDMAAWDAVAGGQYRRGARLQQQRPLAEVPAEVASFRRHAAIEHVAETVDLRPRPAFRPFFGEAARGQGWQFCVVQGHQL